MKRIRRVLSGSVAFAGVGFVVAAAAGAVPTVGSNVLLAAINVLINGINGGFLLGIINDTAASVANLVLVGAAIGGVVASGLAIWGIVATMTPKLSLGWVSIVLITGVGFVTIASVEVFTRTFHWSVINNIDAPSFAIGWDYAIGVALFAFVAAAAAGLVGAVAGLFSSRVVRMVRIVTYTAISVIIGASSVFGAVVPILAWGISPAGIVGIIGDAIGVLVVVLATVFASLDSSPTTNDNGET